MTTNEPSAKTKAEHTKYNKSLKASVLDGIYFSIMFGCAEAYFAAYAVFLKLSAFQVGLMSSIPLLLGAFSQIISVRQIEKGASRKKLLSKVVLLQALTLLPMAALSTTNFSQITTACLLISITCLYFIFGHMGMPVWVSLMGDLVPPEIKGRYFGKRNKISGIAMLLAIVSTGTFLHFAKMLHLTAYAFLIAFAIAAFARIMSSYYLSKHQDVPFIVRSEDHFSFYQFVIRIPYSNFATYTIFFSLMHFALYLAGPYFAVYMLTELELSYFEFTFLSTIGLSTQFLMMQFWGSISDRFGNKFIFNICSVALCFAPALWVFGSNIWYLALVNCFGGFFWAGFNLAAGNFLLDAVSPAKRGRCNAYLWIINASCIVLGSYLGGLMLEAFDNSSILKMTTPYISSHYLLLFLASGIVRTFIIVIFLPRFKEVREVEEFSAKHISYSISRIQAFAGTGFSYATGIFRNKDRKFNRQEFLDREVDK